MTEITIHHIDVIEQLISNSDLEIEKAYEEVEKLTEKFATINLIFLATLSSKEFLNYIRADYKVELESKREAESEKLKIKNKELLKQIYETDKNSPNYEKLINTGKELAEKIADFTVSYSLPIFELEKYQPQLNQLHLNLQDRLNESDIDKENIKSKITWSKFRKKISMVILAIISAIVSDYIVLFLEEKLKFEKLHLIFVVLITLFLVLTIEPKQKKYEFIRNRRTLLNQIKLLKDRYYIYDTKIKSIASNLNLTKDDLWEIFKSYLSKFKK